jgi:mannose-6-phosphate isomerase
LLLDPICRRPQRPGRDKRDQTGYPPNNGMPSVFRISGAYQNYDWGKRGLSSQVAQLASATDVAGKAVDVDEGKPYAELWMGTHPSGPSHVYPTSDLLKKTVDAQGKELLGDKIDATYHDLPYLFKVLSIAKALSIQAHPDKTLAKELHKNFPQHYKDDNHKPEMAIALTDFEAFCGFKPLEEIAACLEKVPEFATVAGKSVTDEFIATVTAKKDVTTNKAALKKLLNAVMTADTSLVKTQLSALVERFSKTNPKKGSLEELVVRLDQQYPGGDIGCFTMMLLNYVQLKSGEAMFLRANMPHAYLSGGL